MWPQHLSPEQGWRQGGHLWGRRRWRPDERKRKNRQKVASVGEDGGVNQRTRRLGDGQALGGSGTTARSPSGSRARGGPDRCAP